jgi:hypothetical protein
MCFSWEERNRASLLLEILKFSIEPYCYRQSVTEDEESEDKRTKHLIQCATLFIGEKMKNE